MRHISGSGRGAAPIAHGAGVQAAITVFLLLAAALPAQEQISGAVTRVVDGDTVEVTGVDRVRLHGIDAPELAQPYGSEAKRYLESLIGGRGGSLRRAWALGSAGSDAPLGVAPEAHTSRASAGSPGPGLFGLYDPEGGAGVL